ncbi:MAG: endonuclease NucS [Bryobacter sp.]|nr:endonuclease NucS [Bryobacter sp.]
MEDLIWLHPERFFEGEDLQRYSRQQRHESGISDLIFRHPLGYVLVMEIKRGPLPRESMHQVVKYYADLKRSLGPEPVEMMVVANHIPAERRRILEPQGISCVEIPERKFRMVAQEVGYQFLSEESLSGDPAHLPRAGQIIIGHYPPCEGHVAGDWEGVINGTGRNEIEVTYYYDNGTRETTRLPHSRSPGVRKNLVLGESRSSSTGAGSTTGRISPEGNCRTDPRLSP